MFKKDAGGIMETEYTARGFAYSEFEDRNDVKCSIQKSSIATEDCIWFGANEIGLQHFKAGDGWNEVKLTDTIKEHYNANTRMHLSVEQVKEIIPILQYFVKTGDLPQNKGRQWLNRIWRKK